MYFLTRSGPSHLASSHRPLTHFCEKDDHVIDSSASRTSLFIAMPTSSPLGLASIPSLLSPARTSTLSSSHTLSRASTVSRSVGASPPTGDRSLARNRSVSAIARVCDVLTSCSRPPRPSCPSPCWIVASERHITLFDDDDAGGRREPNEIDLAFRV
jgi:hypothetical protein